jgi:iron complex outermembrane receptor protein
MRLILLLLLTNSLATYAARKPINDHQNDDIYVFGHYHDNSLIDFVPSVVELSGEDLLRKKETSLGDTLSSEVGVASSGFGPNAGRPIIRGQDADRVRLLQNGLGTLDASTQSADHAVAIDMLSIDQIEIIRGPMSLLYGPTTTGGIVNVNTDRIHRESAPGLYGKYNVEAQTAQPGTSQAALLNYGTQDWMIHVDASSNNLGEMKVPLANDEVENSFNKQTSYGAGVSRIFDKGHVGISYTGLDQVYGVVAEADVTIDMAQKRFELHSEYRFDNSFINKVRVKSAQSDYKHTEMEGSATGTVFTNVGNESRVELFHGEKGAQGIFGVHTKFNDFAAVGEEAFLPASKTSMIGLFSLYEIAKGKNIFDGSLRFESHKVKKESGTLIDKDFNNINVAFGHTYKLSDTYSLNYNASYTERAPTAQELFALGAHKAASTYVIGDSELKKEDSYALESSFTYEKDANKVRVSAFYQYFNNYIALNPTGGTDAESNLGIFNTSQVNARFYGAEFEGDFYLTQMNKGALSLLVNGDYVRAQTTDNINIARITPARVGLGLEYAQNRWTVDLMNRLVFSQSKTAAFETTTKSYTLTDVGTHYDLVRSKTSLMIYAKLRNLFDQEARNHVSAIKNLAPLAGRNFVAGLQGTF